MLLELRGLCATVDGVAILKGVDLAIAPGQVHALMGPNGSGKSTLSNVIAGHPAYTVTGGDILLDGESLLELPVEERARRGLFLSFQHPVEIPGVPTATFLRDTVNAVRAARGEAELSAAAFLKQARAVAGTLGLDDAKLKRALNEGFSGGEKKRNEVLQMTLLAPRVAILDELDSGLDVDAMRLVAAGVNALRSPERGMLVITHYQRLLDYVVPDVTHVLVDGRIVHSGGPELAGEIELRGFAAYDPRVAAPVAP